MQILWVGFGKTGQIFHGQFGEEHPVIGIRRSLTQEARKNLVSIEKDVQEIELKDLQSENIHTVVWSLPPLTEAVSLLQQWNQWLPSKVNFIFLSSTSVLGQGDLDELSKADPQSKNGILLAEAESLVQNWKRSWTILRPGGLFDDDSHPGNYLSQRDRVRESNTPVNLVHRFDLARSIQWVIAENHWMEIFNVVFPEHPTKQAYYGDYIKSRGLPQPQWLDDGSSQRVVHSDKIQKFGFRFEKDLLSF